MSITIKQDQAMPLIAGFIGFSSFFMPWIDGGKLGQPSGYDLMNFMIQLGENRMYSMWLIPICFIISVLSRMNIMKPSLIFLKILEIVPLALFLLFSFYFLDSIGFKPKTNSKFFQEFLGDLRLGLPLTLISCILVASARIPKYSRINNTVESDEGGQKVKNEQQSDGSPKEGHYSSEKPHLSSRQNIDYHSIGKEIGYSWASIVHTLQHLLIKLFKKCQEHLKKILTVAFLLICAVILWSIFIKKKPTTEALSLVEDQCQCFKEFNENVVNEYSNFLNSFDPKNYATRSSARQEFFNIGRRLEEKQNNCLSLVHGEFIRRKAFFTQEKQMIFLDTYYTNQNQCLTNRANDELQRLSKELENKLSLIELIPPTADRLKNDLIGKEVPGWKFSLISDFQTFDIINKVRSTFQLEHEVHMTLSNKSSDKSYTCNATVVYKILGDSWVFDRIQFISLSYTENFHPNQWTSITLIPNCNLTYENQQRLSWKTNAFGRTLMTGPDQPETIIPFSRSYLIKSREQYDVNVDLTFTPTTGKSISVTPKNLSGSKGSSITEENHLDASKHLLTVNSIKGLSSADLRIMRNEIFARHGYIFQTDEMRDYFSTKHWYVGRYNDVTNKLTDIEKQNIAFLKTHE